MMLVPAFRSKRILPAPLILLTVTSTLVPLDAETAMTSAVASPETVVTVKSSVLMAFAFSSNVTVNSIDVSLLFGESLTVTPVTVGGLMSAVVKLQSVACEIPVKLLPEISSITVASMST